jgi:acyl CoA:acetate/3-ketoacid CoA transferase beta subunit
MPLTEKSVVRRVYTDIGTFDIEDGVFVPREIPPGCTKRDLRKAVSAPLRMPQDQRPIVEEHAALA